MKKTARDYLSELTEIAYDLQSQISNSNILFELSSKILSAIEKLKEDYVIVPKSKVYKYTDYGAPKFDFITESWSIKAKFAITASINYVKEAEGFITDELFVNEIIKTLTEDN